MPYLKLIFLGLVITACAVSPLGRRQLQLMPNAQMEQMGQQAFGEMKKKQVVLKDPAVQEYVACIAGHLLENVEGAKADEWESLVFEDESPNAFALPGGRIGVHSGMLKLANTPAQLAAVMGHEVGHVIAEHGNERVSQALAVQGALALSDIVIDWEGPKGQLVMAALGVGAQVGYLLPYSRIQEREADLIGLKLMAEAGFQPLAAVELWKNMQKATGSQPPEFLSTHPSHESRIERLEENMKEAQRIYRNALEDGKRPNCEPPS